MQRANVLVALGGDRGNTVPKYGVTVSEIAVLMAIHGNDAVTEIEPLEDDGGKFDNRAELARLLETYKGRDEGGVQHVTKLFPGAGARLFEELDELGLPEEFFKATERMSAKKAEAPKKPARKSAAKAKQADAEPEGESDEQSNDENVLG